MKKNLSFSRIILLTLLVSSCSIPRIYQVVISQGNLVDQEMLDKLEVGMTESQVKFVTVSYTHLTLPTTLSV